MARVVAVCVSEQKGTRKEAVKEGLVQENFGILGDAHADGGTHRQLSLLAVESIDEMRNLGFDIGPGDFAENLTCEGIKLTSLPVGTRLLVGEEVILEVSQIGKKCHSGCAIYRQIGNCIMPREGVFARVIHGGLVRTGDTIKRHQKAN
jgi:MOSC domain-containing protein YiiM